ncbi:ketopantoate reductase family protein, partial [Selenomonas sp.]|uniref:ketopantoate reductase family protein n=1 Tax=Selenomonas sp. TaxID=2053611 RepID=UPI002A762F17
LKAQEVEKILRAAGISAHFSDDIRRDALQKFAFVSPMGACGLYENAVSGDMQPGGRARETFVELVKEVKALGEAMGVAFTREPVTEGCKIMDASAPTLTTSMQRDVAAGGRSEFAGLVDRVAALAEKYHVDVPLYQKISAWGKEKGIR